MKHVVSKRSGVPGRTDCKVPGAPGPNGTETPAFGPPAAMHAAPSGRGRFLAASLVAALVSACSILPTMQTGTLILSLAPRLIARTVVPNLNMTPASYDVTGVGPGGATFEQLGLSSTTVVQPSLIPGEWTVTVEAFNDDVPPTLIGLGSIMVAVVSGQVLNETVTIEPVQGAGVLDIDVTWPAGVLAGPSVVATLTPVGGTTDPSIHGIPMPVSGASAGYHRAAVPSGYYMLAMALDEGGAPVWGTVEAVRIIAGQITHAQFDLIEDVNRGGLELSIEEELDNPIDVSLDQPDGVEVAAGETLSVTATTSEPVESYAWFLQAAPQGATGNTIDLVLSTPGHYRLTVVVAAGDVLSSAQLDFTVVEGSSTAGSLWVYAVAYPDTTGPSFTAGAYVLDRSLIDLSGYATIEELGQSGTLTYEDLLAAVVSDATVTANGQTLPLIPGEPAYAGQIDAVAPGGAITFVVNANGETVSGTVVVPGSPTITSVVPGAARVVHSPLLEADVTVESADVAWTQAGPDPVAFHVGFGFSIGYSGPSNSSFGTGGVSPDLGPAVRSAHAEPSADGLSVLFQRTYESIIQSQLSSYTFSAVRMRSVQVIATSALNLGGPAGELPSFIQVQRSSESVVL